MIRPVKSDFRFHHDIRVRFADTDLQAIVFNANYLTYYDVAWTEYFRAVGFEWKDLLALGVDTVLARTTMEFKSPARFDEILEIHTRVSRIGTTSLTFEFEIYPRGEDRLINTANSLYVCVDPKTLKSTPVPDRLRRCIGAFEGTNYGASA
jgi:acyl-CoA thioester hydrolase